MEPFSKEDPLHTLLGKRRPVEPRPNFTQNVLREARQTPQHLSFWERFTGWLRESSGGRVLWQGASVAAAVTLALLVFRDSGSPPEGVHPVATANSEATLTSPGTEGTASPAVLPVETVVVAELEELDELSVLLAQENTSALSDSDMLALLY